LPFQVYWDNITWEKGTLRAEGINKAGQVLCSDEKITAGAPARVELTVEPPLVKPNGETFQVTANGSDAAFILAKIVDAQGVWCPTATNDITFAITSGDAEYRGGTCALVKQNNVANRGYRSPLDPTLPAEGGMTKIAIKSRFTEGPVTVTATSPNLTTGTATFTIYPAKDIAVPVQGPVGSAVSSTALAARLEAFGGTVKYFLGRPADVSVEILNAGGRVIRQIASSRQPAGWHPVQLSGSASIGEIKGNGVYFVRCTVDGNRLNVKRVVILR
jgi:hypothetical protein